MCNVVTNFAEMVRILFVSVLPSLMDLSSDILNALDMIWVGKKLKNVGKITGIKCPGDGTFFDFEKFLNMCKDKENRSGFDSSALGIETCGYISIGIVFLPGIVKALKMLASRIEKGEYLRIPMVIFYLPFPIYIMYIQIRALMFPKDPTSQQKLIKTLGMEAFYESFPQLVLQFTAIIYAYPQSNLQLLSISFSTFMLAKTVILLDSAQPVVDEKSENNSAKDTSKNRKDQSKRKHGLCLTALITLWKGIKYTFWVLPLYLTSVLFKVAAFSLTFAYLRLWAFASMVLLLLELIILAKYTGFKDVSSWAYPVCSNFFIVNIGAAHIEIKKKRKISKKTLQEKEENLKGTLQNMYTFAKRAVTVSFLHHSLVLAFIALLMVRLGNKTIEDLTVKKCESGEFPCSLDNFFGRSLNSTKAHWEKMAGSLYPYCKRHVHDKDCNDEGIQFKVEQYQFLMIISGVILTGLFNLILSIYSARDIKAKHDLEDKSRDPDSTAKSYQDPMNHEDSADNTELLKATQSDYVLCFDKDMNAVITNNEKDPLFQIQIKFSSISGNDSLVMERNYESKVNMILKSASFLLLPS